MTAAAAGVELIGRQCHIAGDFQIGAIAIFFSFDKKAFAFRFQRHHALRVGGAFANQLLLVVVRADADTAQRLALIQRCAEQMQLAVLTGFGDQTNIGGDESLFTLPVVAVVGIIAGVVALLPIVIAFALVKLPQPFGDLTVFVGAVVTEAGERRQRLIGQFHITGIQTMLWQHPRFQPEHAATVLPN